MCRTPVTASKPRSVPALHKAQNPSRVEKTSKSLRTPEARSCLATLSELVPTLPRDCPVSDLELVQHVLDYIGTLSAQLANPPRDSDSKCTTPSADPSAAELDRSMEDISNFLRAAL